MSEQAKAAMPVDSDVDLRVARQRRELRRAPWSVLAMISLGGGVGGLARYGLGVWAPVEPGAFPWTTFGVNVSGCLLIGALMVLVTEVWGGHRLVRPFLGVGVLGGYTTFSFHMVEAQHLIEEAAVRTAALYLAGTAVAGLLAVAAGMAGTRWVIRRRAGVHPAGIGGRAELVQAVGRQGDA